VVLKLSNRFFGALAGVRFFFGFRPRLLGIGKQWVGTDQVCCVMLSASRKCRPTPPDGYGGVNAPPAALSTRGVGGGTTDRDFCWGFRGKAVLSQGSFGRPAAHKRTGGLA